MGHVVISKIFFFHFISLTARFSKKKITEREISLSELWPKIGPQAFWGIKIYQEKIPAQ